MTKVICEQLTMRLDSSFHSPLNHSLNHKNCPACKAENNLLAAEKKLRFMGLRQATEVWMESKKRKHHKPKHLECCEGYKNRLTEFFGDSALSDISSGSFVAYQKWRGEKAGPSAINHELNALAQILRRAGLWKDIKDDYAPLKEKDWEKPKSFTMHEQREIFEYSASDPNVELAYIVSRITRNTTASGSELRFLRLRHLDLESDPPRVEIPPEGTKNNARPRTIPLNGEAFEAFKEAVSRANRLGSHLPYHFIFPFRINRKYYDPNRPASRFWLRKQFYKVRDATGVAHLKPHAFRHLAVTELLERGVDEQRVIALAGWVSRKMLETYSHTRIEAKMEAVEMLLPQKKTVQREPTNVIEFKARK